MNIEYIKLDSAQPIIDIADLIREKTDLTSKMSLNEIKEILITYWN